ncbi:hypothetical protein FIBSPDRAFT_933821 [Athelia psychrophila]|uniref:Uncharacterized protein n=1 Tax=Athelia psychrophila TaxID=1759441 RepID=A0A166GJQ6_9AGAM|nr:hypothetical protein FIBSPDRAFT_933821 [Fibularhizoctonia sp. CBS 109695]
MGLAESKHGGRRYQAKGRCSACTKLLREMNAGSEASTQATCSRMELERWNTMDAAGFHGERGMGSAGESTVVHDSLTSIHESEIELADGSTPKHHRARSWLTSKLGEIAYASISGSTRSELAVYPSSAAARDPHS